MGTLVTGITGLLGQKYLDSVIRDTKTQYHLLIRNRHLRKWKELCAGYEHIHLIQGDILNPDIFSNQSALKGHKITRIVHLAALYDLGASKNTLFKTNVIGTQNILFFASKTKGLKNFTYASTIAVAGDWQGVFSEEDFDMGQGFYDDYAKTKFEAEGVVREFSQNNPSIQMDILRFGIIIGDSRTGEISKTDGPYYLFEQLSRFRNHLKKLPVLVFPYREASEIPVVPVDFAAQTINGLKKGKKGLRVLHILSHDNPSNKELLTGYLKALKLDLRVMPIPSFKLLLTGASEVLSKMKIPTSLIHYMYSRQKIVSHDLENALLKSIRIPSYKDFSGTIFEYATKTFR